MSVEQNPGKAPTGGQTGKVPPATFTKERVNELMQKRVERSHQAFFNRYGVKDLSELDGLFAKAKGSDEMKAKIEELTKGNADLQTRFDELTNQNRELTKKYALTNRHIKPELYADIETYFKGKGIDINEETLDEELKTHADWCNKATGTIVPLGNDGTRSVDNEVSERAAAGKLLGVEL